MKLSNLFLLVLLMSSCNEPNARRVVNENNNPQKIVTTNKTEYSVFEWEHKGHTYIVIDRSHGSGITHAGHCKCNQH